MADKPLTRDEVAALLTGIAETITNKDKRHNIHDTQIVLVLYGEKHITTHTSVHLFYNDGWNSAKEYCDKINGLNLIGDEWIHAKIINENHIEELNKTFFINDITFLDDRAVQRIICSIDKETLRKALKNMDEEPSQKIKKNMSKRALKMLEEDMEYFGPVRLKDVYKAQKKIVDTIKHMEDAGEIVIARNY